MTEPQFPRQPLGARLFSFAVVADTHVNESEDTCASPFATNARANARARHVFADIARLDPAPAFAIHLGDIVHPVPGLPSFEEAARRFKAIASQIDMPLHLVPGNHDVGDKRIDWMPADVVCDGYLDKYRGIFGPTTTPWTTAGSASCSSTRCCSTPGWTPTRPSASGSTGNWPARPGACSCRCTIRPTCTIRPNAAPTTTSTSPAAAGCCRGCAIPRWRRYSRATSTISGTT